MISTTARARLLTALLMIAGTFSVALVAESATAAHPYKVTLSVSDRTPAVGQLLKMTGKVTPAAPGKRVKVQGRAAGTGWVTVSRPVLTTGSTFKASFRFPRAGSVTMRIVKPASGGHSQGTSPQRRLRVGGGLSAPVITTATLPQGIVGRPYTATVETADGRPGLFGAVGLPAGLTIDSQRGTITGTPTAQGTTNFTVYFRDADRRTASKALSITVAPAGIARPLPDITTTELANGQRGVAYSTTLGVTNNLAGKWAATSALPAGLTLNTSTGVISGTPTTPGGPTAFAVTFTETATNFSDTQNLSIRIASAPGPVIRTTSLAPGYSGNPYSATLAATSVRAGSWAVTGALPDGLTLNPATGVISGTPTTPSTTPVISRFTVTFTQPGGSLLDPARTDSQPLTIKIDPDSDPVVSNSSLPDAFVGKAFRDTLTTAANRSGTWAVTSGALPAGLSLKSTTGEITGVPGVAGTASFIVTFTALNGKTDTEDFTLLVKP